jgi:flagellar basal-body rod protein FlgB
MLDRIDSDILRQRTALNLRSYRQELLAGNIANADTPHFKARDLDFSAAYKSALGGRQSSDLDLKRTSARHLEGAGGMPFGNLVQYRSEFQSAVDGNTVNMDIERAAFAENAVRMEASLTFIREKFRGLSAATQAQ